MPLIRFISSWKLGPGLLEQIYETCLVKELTKKNLKILRQVPVPVIYDGG